MMHYTSNPRKLMGLLHRTNWIKLMRLLNLSLNDETADVDNAVRACISINWLEHMGSSCRPLSVAPARRTPHAGWSAFSHPTLCWSSVPRAAQIPQQSWLVTP